MDKMIREATNMSAFTFYLDDLTKLKVIKKLKGLGVDPKKGALSATIRVLLNEFADDAFTGNSIVEKIESEYTFTTKKNNRSSL
jgi:hypothetical protein